MAPLRRILVLNERDPEHPRAGGAEIHVERICSRLAARGHTLLWHSTGFPGAPSRARVGSLAIERRGPLPLYYAGLPGRVRGLVRREAIDLVVDCLNKVPFQAPLYAPVPVLALCHHLFGSVAFEQVAWPIAMGVVAAEWPLARVYRDCEVVAISESTRADLRARGLPAARITVSPPGIDRPGIPADPESPRPVRIAYLGRLERYKRIDVMLRAGALLVPRFPDLELVVIGQGPARAGLEKLAGELGLAARTRFTGFLPDEERDRLLAETRVCVFPSEKEGWGLTVIEANALATPVVARNAPGLRDSIREGETGRLVDTADPGSASEDAAYAEAIADLLEESEATRAVRRACLDWSKRFDWDRAADDMEAAVERALAGPSGRTS